jgi:acyl-CoA thioesterase-1
MTASRVTRLVASAAGLALTLGVAIGGAAAATSYPLVVERTTDASPDGPVVVAIGDSIMEGHGLDPSSAWPALLAQEDGWRLTNLASDGSGFVTVGNNGDTFADQMVVAARLKPSIVLVSGSSNDLGQPDARIAQATQATILALHKLVPSAEIVDVSPVWNDTGEPAQLTTIDADVANAVAAVGGETLRIGQPLAGLRDLLQGDDVHPTAEGQEQIAAAVQKQLVRGPGRSYSVG